MYVSIETDVTCMLSKFFGYTRNNSKIFSLYFEAVFLPCFHDLLGGNIFTSFGKLGAFIIGQFSISIYT